MIDNSLMTLWKILNEGYVHDREHGWFMQFANPTFFHKFVEIAYGVDKHD